MFDEKMLSDLRIKVGELMSLKRYKHTLGVEKMAAILGDLYLPEKIDKLRAAALLHDITKEYSVDMQLQKCREFGIMVSKQDMLTPKTFHAKTAAAMIPVEFPQFSDDEIISAVRWHTTGHEGMTMMEKLIYLADYIDDTNVLIASYDMTIRCLISENSLISDDTFKARNELIINNL